MKRCVYSLFPLFIACLFAVSSQSRPSSARVVGVSDGDTIKAVINGRQVKVRLYGIDCPEKKQAFGKRAKEFTARFLYRKNVQIEPINKDHYGRLVALVYAGNASLNAELVKNGLAWVYGRYCKKPLCDRLYDYQRAAQRKKHGLWADPNPVPPWQFRKK